MNGEYTMKDIIYLGCDDSGCELKAKIIAYLEENGYEYKDCGSDETPSRYPYYAAKVAAAVSRGEIARGILICGSGVGISIAANKFKGVRAALCTEAYSARLTRRHNDSNILCLGGRMLGVWQGLRIVDTWLNTEYDGGHHQGSLDLITQMEDCMFSGEVWEPNELPYPEFEWNEDQGL